MVGLDLGTAFTRIWLQDKGIILRCPTAVAIDGRTHEVVALGDRARRMLGKTPEDILAYRPLKDGVIADFQVAADMLNEFFYRKQLASLFNRPVVLVSAPYRITEVERFAVENAVFEAGARAVAQVPSAYAAAVGAGLRVRSPRGCMIVEIGAGTCEVAIISSGGIISARSLKVAGVRFDMAIVNYLKNRMDLLIGESTAEMLKIRIGSADPSVNRGSMTVCGRNVRTGLAASLDIGSLHICDAISPSLDAIVRTIMSALEDAPPEIAGDIFEFGIMLCGGSALMSGLPSALAARTGLRVTVARDPLDCVCRGIGTLIMHPELFGDMPEFKAR